MLESELSTCLKIVDFGICGMFKVGQDGDKSDAGSVKYIAPEILKKIDNSATPALDIWSLGCIFYAMLTGDVPFTGESKKEILSKIIEV